MMSPPSSMSVLVERRHGRRHGVAGPPRHPLLDEVDAQTVGRCSATALVTRSPPWPTTTTARSMGSSARACRTWRTIGRPHSRWSGLGRSERILVPSPAARTTLTGSGSTLSMIRGSRSSPRSTKAVGLSPPGPSAVTVRSPWWRPPNPPFRGSSIGRTPAFGAGCLEVRALPPEPGVPPGARHHGHRRAQRTSIASRRCGPGSDSAARR